MCPHSAERAATVRGKNAIREIGIPVRSVNWVRLHAGLDRSGRPCLCAAMGQESEHRLDPVSLDLREVVRDDEGGFRTAGPIVGSEVLFGRNHRLMAAEIR